MIEVAQVTKRFGSVTAVDAMSFTVAPGVVTGFLGPNGAGKSTTMRMILGLDRPNAGEILVNGQRYADLSAPIATIGALLDAKAVDKARSARNHLRAVGATVGVPTKRVDEVLEIVGLTDVASSSAGSFSLGMGQRLGIAQALLADPAILLLDEPVNGLDPDGILWIRGLMRDLAAEGRTVFVSSHLMSEMELTADHLIIVGRGKVLADTSMDAFIAANSHTRVVVRSPRAAELAAVLADVGLHVTRDDDETLTIDGAVGAMVGDLAAAAGVPIHQLVDHQASLEEAFMDLTRDSVEYHGGTATTHDNHTTTESRAA
ncbi:MAG: ABC transporter ATP-binding protein [Candidatus Nanopelagicales bacterium]